jgi:murein DD-endopeptidase MepM/ murein hydrolase activator NlpD
MAEPARTRRTSRTAAVPADVARETSAVSRRDARVQRALTGPQQTVWSSGASGESSPAVADVVAAEVAVIAAAVAADPGGAQPVEVVQPATAAPVTESAAPMTRASRRIRTAPTQIIGEPGEPLSAAPTESPAEPFDPIVPAAALAWAAAAAAAVEQTQIVPVEPVQAPAEPFELLEPVEADDVQPIVEQSAEPAVDPDPEPAIDAEPTIDAEPAASDVDEFELAARLFSFTGETAVQSAVEPDSEADATTGEDAEASADEGIAAASHVAPTRRSVRNVGRQVTTASFSVGVMGIVGLLAVGMTTPAAAVAGVNGTDSTSLLASDAVESDLHEEDIQAWVAPVDMQSATLERDENYSSVSMGELASEEGITNYSNFFINDPNAAIQWPFAVGVPITYGFGMRSGRMHEGADFVPGQGAEIQAIADGIVRIATTGGGAYGVTVVIDHIIDGQLVSSRYAHMLYGSLNVSAGQHVTVGTVLGKTGNTGRSYGAHTHFEILQGGTTAVDPIAWLRAYTGRYSLDQP